jgi:hypothetical protein
MCYIGCNWKPMSTNCFLWVLFIWAVLFQPDMWEAQSVVPKWSYNTTIMDAITKMMSRQGGITMTPCGGSEACRKSVRKHFFNYIVHFILVHLPICICCLVTLLFYGNTLLYTCELLNIILAMLRVNEGKYFPLWYFWILQN